MKTKNTLILTAILFANILTYGQTPVNNSTKNILIDDLNHFFNQTDYAINDNKTLTINVSSNFDTTSSIEIIQGTLIINTNVLLSANNIS